MDEKYVELLKAYGQFRKHIQPFLNIKKEEQFKEAKALLDNVNSLSEDCMFNISEEKEKDQFNLFTDYNGEDGDYDYYQNNDPFTLLSNLLYDAINEYKVNQNSLLNRYSGLELLGILYRQFSGPDGQGTVITDAYANFTPYVDSPPELSEEDLKVLADRFNVSTVWC